MTRRHARGVALLMATGIAVMIQGGAPGLAAEPAKKDKGAKSDKPEMPVVDPLDIDLSAVGLPIIWNDRLVNYVFVKVRLHASAHSDPAKLREKEPHLRDALVRAGARTPFVIPWDFVHVDEAALASTMMRASAQILGPGQIVRVLVTSQKPQRTTGLPVKDAQPRAASPDLG